MELKQLFLAQPDREAAATRRTLERVPEGRNEWKPHEKSMTLGYLSGLVASMPSWAEFMIERAKVEALRVISEHLIPDRWAEVRGPSDSELKATTVLEFSIDEVSSKVPSGPPLDKETDYRLPVWAGVLPLEIRSRERVPDVQLLDGVALPDYKLHRYPAPRCVAAAEWTA